MVRGYLLGFVALVLVAVLTLLSQSRPPKRHHAQAGKAPVIGFSMDSLVVERWMRDIAVFTRSARDLGAEVILEVSGQDPAVQEQQIRALLARGIDVLVIVPNDADRLRAVVSEVKAKGIPVICYDRLVKRANVDLYISFDNEKVGSLMAEAITQAVPTGGFVIINGARNDHNAIMLSDGIHRVLDPRLTGGKTRLVSEIWPESWDNEKARTGLEAVIAKDRNISAVIAGNDMLAEAAIRVLSENSLMGKVKVAGQDADLAACQRIAEGSQYVTIYKPIDQLALKAAGFAVMLAKGESITTDATIDDGAGKVPYVRLEPVLVTKDLLDATVIKDGFHTSADVYRNVHR